MWPEYVGAFVAVVALTLAIVYGRGWGLRTAERATVTSAVDGNFGIAAFTLDGHFITANERFQNLVGYRLADLRGRHHQLLLDDSAHNGPAEHELWEALRKGERQTGVYQWVLGGGARVWIGAAYYPVLNRRGRAREIIAFVNDVTERKEQDAKYRELAAIVEASDDAIAGLDVDGTIRSWNRGAERLLGYAPADVIGQPSAWLVPRERAGEATSVIERLRRGDVVSRLETERVMKDGTTITVSVSAFPIRNEMGVVTGFAKVSRDITDRKQAEARLATFAAELEQRNEELAEARDRALAATRAKSAFLATMSHEIRTPMNAVLGMAELLGETALSPEQAEYVGRLNRGAVNLLELVNDVLDLSKIEADSLKLEQVAFDLGDVVDHVAELMAVRATAKGVELTALVHPDVPTWVLGDPTRVRQVLLNLVGNAVKFTEHGEVTIRVEPDASREGHTRVAVSDSGIGIPEDRRQSVFESFSQVDSSTTRKYGGTGLGLSISRRLVELMGGQIGLTSDAGRGSTFFFSVPLAEATGRAPEEMPEVDLRGRRILVVDDQETNRLIVRSHCLRAGAELVEAVDGARAIVALNESERRGDPIDVAIVDLQMPGMDGIELAQAIRGRTGCGDIPIVLCASDVTTDRAELARELGVIPVFKPISRRRLFDALARACATQPGVAATTPAPVRVADAAPDRKVRVLLVEDMEDNRDLVALFLQGTPHQLTTAENGADGLRTFREGDFDLVLTDVQMPVMDGYAMTAAIRAWERKLGRTATPIVALTASAFQDDVERTLAAGCDAHLVKPIRRPALLEAIVGYSRPPAEGRQVEADLKVGRYASLKNDPSRTPSAIAGEIHV